MELLFYDIECFKYDSLVVFKRLDGSIYKYMWYSDDTEFWANEIGNIIGSYQLAGYNNYYYDDKILTLMSRGAPQNVIKANNDALISGEDIRLELCLNSIDVMQQIDVSKPSLKQIEGNMGMSILESSVPFDIDRPLTKDEREEALYYCCHDVDATIEVYKLRKDSYFTVKEELLKMQDSDIGQRWNTTSIIADILIPERGKYQKLRHIYMVDKEYRQEYPFIPKEAWEVWSKANIENVPRDASLTINKFGCEVTFGFGGLHGAPSKPIRCENVMLLDVGSMYPSIIVNLESLGVSTNIYDDIRKERLRIKHSDPVKATALKLILNSTYGLLKNNYSMLYNPKASSQVCIYGQIALYDLCIRLDALGYRIININTDGVAFDDPLRIGDKLGDLYKEAWKDWEAEYKLTLELDTFDLWIQRDVNNYIATKGDHVKVKGGDVNKAFNNKYFSNNSARILHQGLVYALIHRDEPTWQNSNLLYWLYEKLDDPLLFQYILKAGRTFKGVYDSEGNKLQNVNRVFACKSDGTSLRKVRQDGGYVKFPDAPERMYIWNDDVSKLKNLGSILDINHYYQLILRKLENWT